MKKLFFTALLVAGTTLGFAKDNVQNSKSTHTESSKKVESNVEKPQTIYQFDTLEEAQKFLKDCTVLTAAYTMVDGELELVSICETTSPCILQEEGTTTIVAVIV